MPGSRPGKLNREASRLGDVNLDRTEALPTQKVRTHPDLYAGEGIADKLVDVASQHLQFKDGL